MTMDRSRPLLPGVNLVGFHNALLGLGQTARLMRRSLELAGIAHDTVTYRNSESQELFQQHLHEARGTPRYDTNLLCLNADQLPRFARQVGAGFFAGRRNIGICFWETETLPDEHRAGLQLLDEIWVASDFIRQAVEEATDRPVRVFPHPVARALPEVDETGIPAQLEFGERRVFLTSFDFLSDVQRKNPAGAIEAFCRAFPLPGGIGARDPLLVIKSINAARRPLDALTLQQQIGDRPDIRWIDGHLPPDQYAALTARADAFLSLHRSEGFGLNLAEAMALGTPVIATGYSGNLAFMDRDNSFLTPVHRSQVGPLSEHYPPHHHWGEPDLDCAARWLRFLCTDPGKLEAGSKAAMAKVDLHLRHSPEATAGFLIAQLSKKRRTWTSRGEEASIPQTPYHEAKALLEEGLSAGPKPTRRATGTFFMEIRRLGKHLLKSIKQLEQKQKRENQQLRAEIAKLTEMVTRLSEPGARSATEVAISDPGSSQTPRPQPTRTEDGIRRL